MIRLGDSGFWLDADASGWVLVRALRKGSERLPPERFGPFTSPRHVLQQRQVRLPKAARAAVQAVVDAMEAGDDFGDSEPPRDAP